MNGTTERTHPVSGILGAVMGSLFIAIGCRFLYPSLKLWFFYSVPEAEVQTYLMGLALFLVWIFFAPTWMPFLNRIVGTFRTTLFDRRALAAYALICSIVFASLLTESVSGTDMTMQLGQMGIQLTHLSPTVLAGSLAFLITLLLLLMAPKPRSFPFRSPLFFLVVLLLVSSTFYVGRLAYYDATHFIGPIHDMILGAPPLSSPSWYGFLPVGFLALLFRIVPLSLVNIYVAVAIIETLGYILFYVFALKLWNDDRRAVVTTLIAVLFHFMVQSVDRNYYLQSTFVRFGIWMPVAFALLAAGRKDVLNFFRAPWLIAAVAFAFFWTTDMGLYVTCAFIGTVILTSPAHPIFRRIFVSLQATAPVLLGLFCSFIIISGLIYGTYGVIPDWSNYWQFAWSYRTVSMFALPVTFSIFPIFFLSIPIASIGLLVGKHARSLSYRGEDLVIMFLSLLSLFMFTYYTGDSHLNSLHTINLPVVICLMWIVTTLLTWIARQEPVTRMLMICTIALLGMVPVSLWTNQAIHNMKTGNILTTMRAIQAPEVTEYDIVGTTALGVKQAYQATLAQGDFAIISPWDTWYVLIWNTTNSLGSNCLLCYWTPEMATKLTATAKRLNVTYLFVDRDRTGYEGRVSWIFTDDVSRQYMLIDRIGNLDIYKRIY